MKVKMNDVEEGLKNFFEHCYKHSIEDGEIKIIGYSVAGGNCLAVEIEVLESFSPVHGGRIVRANSDGSITLLLTEE